MKYRRRPAPPLEACDVRELNLSTGEVSSRPAAGPHELIGSERPPAPRALIADQVAAGVAAALAAAGVAVTLTPGELSEAVSGALDTPAVAEVDSPA